MDDVDDEICEVAVTFIFLVACAFGLTRRWRNYTNLRSAAIPHHRHSAWAILWQNGSDNDFLVTCGIDRATFNELHDIIFDDESNSRGRPHKLDTHAQLGMYLHFLNSTMRQKTLAQLFGVTNPTVSRILRRLIVLVPRKLRRNAKCRVEWPSTDKMAQLSRLVSRRMPGLTNIFGFVDGLSVPCQTSTDQFEQNAYYNGWKAGTFVSNIFVFSTEGKIVFASLNCPGSWHDSSNAFYLYWKLVNECEGYAIAADTAFPRSGLLEDKILTSLKNGDLDEDHILARHQMRSHCMVTSVRQAAEWGMRAIQGTFGQLKIQMTSNKRVRRNIVEGIVLIHNIRTENIGINQITTVFGENYEQGMNELPYDRIARYYNIL